MNKKDIKSRYNLIDILRGTSVICMIIYHTMWDLVYLFDVEIPLFRSNAMHIFQQYILWSFVIISGFCINLCKKPLKRGFITLGASIILSTATLIVIPDATVIFGVLTFLGTAMVITGATKKHLSAIRYYVGIPVSVLLFMLTYNIPDGNLGFGSLVIAELPISLYTSYITAFFGFPQSGFSSADYVPLIPWIFLYLFGFFLYNFLKSKDWLKKLSVAKLPPLEWTGRHALIIYLAHQPVIFVVLYLVFRII